MLKIQYPGVSDAIESDLKTMKSLFLLMKVIPKGQGYDQIFDEVKEMLYREMDYQIEKESLETFFELFEGRL